MICRFRLIDMDIMSLRPLPTPPSDPVGRGVRTDRPDSVDEGAAAGANSVVGKVRLILEAFGMDDSELSLSELARRTGISKATVHRLSQELLEWGVLERAGCEYRLGMRVFEMGSRVPRMRVLREGVRPFMESLHLATKETVHLGIRDGLDVLYLEKISAHRQAARPSRVAGRMPLHSTATGKVLLAHAPREVLEDMAAAGLRRLTPSTVVLPGLLVEQLRTVRQTGYAIEREETVVGYCSVAVPLMGSGGLVLGALSVTAPSFRADIAGFVKALTEVSRQLARAQLIN